MAGKGILLNEDNTIKIVNKRMVVGPSEMQEVGIILGMNQGELKSDPILGPDLVNLIKSNVSRFNIEQRVRTHLARDRKEYSEIKEKIQTNIQ